MAADSPEQSQSSLDLSAIDMTLLLGADSFLRHRLPGGDAIPPDPVGSQCLINFVDLVVNAEACFLMLPSKTDYPTQLPLACRVPALKRLRNSADVHLNVSTEKRVVREFKSLIKDYEFLSQWFRAHWGNPATPRHQSPALGSLARQFATISDEGWGVLMQYLGKTELDRLEPLALSMPQQTYLADDIAKAGGQVAFQYAYTFDTFRRGWQYAASSSYKKRQLWYCPHRIRQRALEAGSKSWLESSRERYWSWGRCLVTLIESAQHMSEPERVTDWINGIVESHPPRWVEVSEAVTSGLDTREARIARRDLIDMVEAVARSARIPMMLLTRPPLPVKLARLAVEHVSEELKLGTIEGVLEILPAKAIAARIKFRATETAKDTVNFIYKGTFGYPGLISPSLRSKAAPPKQPVYLF